jgi:hypothetical protein
MTASLDSISRRMLATSRAMFRARALDELPRVYAELLFDPSDRYARVCAAALATSAQADEAVGRELSSRSPVSARSNRRVRPPGPDRQMAGEGAFVPPPRSAVQDQPLHRYGMEPVSHPLDIAAALQASLRTGPVRSTREFSARGTEAGSPSGNLTPAARRVVVGGPVFVKPKGGGPGLGGERTSRSPRHSTGHDREQQGGLTDSSRHDQPVAALRLARNISGIGRLLAVDLDRENPMGREFPEQRPAVLPDVSPSEPIPSRAVSPPPKLAAPEIPAGEPPTSFGPPAPLAIDAIVDEIERRLRLEYLRSYGASGGF